MEGINVSKFLQMKEAIDSVPFNLYDHESVPVTTYKLTKLIENIVFSHKQ